MKSIQLPDVFPIDTADWKQLFHQRRSIHHRSHLLRSFDLLVCALQDAALRLGLGSPLDVVSVPFDQLSSTRRFANFVCLK